MNALNEAEVTFPALNSCCYQRKDSSHRSLTSDSTNRHSGDHFKSHFGTENNVGKVRLIPTTCKHQVPLVFHEPHMERGFRVIGQPWTYYFWSIFQLHNETVNVWTHIMAFGLMTSKMVSFSFEVDFVNDSRTWPLLAGLLCGMALYCCSSGAHCLQSRSELVHYTAFMFDYAGIGLYGLGSVIMHLEYCSEDCFYDFAHSVFVPCGCIFAFLICFCCSISKTIYTRPYPFVRKIWQLVPVGGIYILLISPIVHRLALCYVYGYDCNESIPYHIQQMFWFASSGFFFTSEYPQKLWPRLCDHFFHSHQLFHISIMICTLKQMDAVFIDFQTRKNLIELRPLPSFWSAFGPVVIVCLAELLCIYGFSKQMKRRLDSKRASH